jgi:hypothetical protein
VHGGVLGDLVGELKERFLRTPVADLVDFFDNTQPLIGVNPYCYDRMDLDGAQKLSKLIEETDTLIFTFIRTPEEARVSHVSLVLKEPIDAIGASASAKPLVKANPQFQDMMEAIAALERYV